MVLATLLLRLPRHPPTRPLSAFLSASPSNAFRNLTNQTVQDSIQVRAKIKHQLSPEEHKEWAVVPFNEGKLKELGPKLYSRVLEQLTKGLDKHEIEGEAQISNDVNYFAGLDSEFIKLTKGNSNATQKLATTYNSRVITNTIEMRKSVQSTREALFTRSGVSKTPTPMCFEILTADRLARNESAHSLDLATCIKSVALDPELEVTFQAYFGLSSTKAKALLHFDKALTFEAHDMLSRRANLIKSGIINTSLEPFTKWLESMDELMEFWKVSHEEQRGQRGQRGPQALEIARRCTRIVSKLLKDDKKTAEENSTVGFVKTKIEREQRWGKSGDVYHWDKILQHWKNTGILGNIFYSWDLPRRTGILGNALYSWGLPRNVEKLFSDRAQEMEVEPSAEETEVKPGADAEETEVKSGAERTEVEPGAEENKLKGEAKISNNLDHFIRFKDERTELKEDLELALEKFEEPWDESKGVTKDRLNTNRIELRSFAITAR